MHRRSLRTLALLAVAGLVSLCLFELGVRLLEPQPETRYRFSPDTYFEPVPGAAFVYRRQEFSVPIRINRFGMRDVERAVAKPARTLRVALLGDSFAEALQVPLDSTLAQQLEREVGACFPGLRVEILNFGVSGFGTAASAARYRALGSRFRPDLVVYLFVDNDVTDLLGPDARLYEIHDAGMRLSQIELGPGRRVLRHAIDFAKNHFHAYRFLRYRLLVLQEGRRLAAARERGAAAGTAELLPGDIGWLRMRQALTCLRGLVEADGATLLVVQANTFGPDMNGRIDALCADLELPFHSLLPALSADPGPIQFRIDGHWRSRGHLVASRDLVPLVCRMLGERQAVPAEPG